MSDPREPGTDLTDDLTDDLGHPVPLVGAARRIVSLVPSITEALAADVRDRLVGATEWCTHPADLDVRRVRGTKNPDLAAIRDLAPDLVVANKEENRELDVRRLRESGIAVWVTDIESVDDALAALERLYDLALALPERPAWLREARELWSQEPPAARGRVVVPVWRDPWMVVGARTYTGDLLARLGWVNAGAEAASLRGAADRYPTVSLEHLDRDDVDLVLLPDEPYVFTADDGPEAFDRAPTRLVSGRLLTWYGPAMVEAHRALSAAGAAT
ncbi:helical backbone metal receptor [Aeromicrobium sp.]|uniref:helical backbone metal receptor n=1 Tax=Aeromicrobium sp. TaxID=1871063 RepID=UPI0035191BAE